MSISCIYECGTYRDIRSYNGELAYITCNGRDNIFDGGDGRFALDLNVSQSTDDDGYLLTDLCGRQWRRVVYDTVLPEWFGVKYDEETDDQVAIQKAVIVAESLRKPLVIQGKALICSSIRVTSSIEIRGVADGQIGCSSIKMLESGTMIDVQTVTTGVVIKNMLLSHYGDGVIANIKGETHLIENCAIIGYLSSGVSPLIYINGSNTYINDCRITNLRVNSFCIDCDRVIGSMNNINSAFSRCYFGGASNGIIIHTIDGSARPEGVEISLCKFVLTGRYHVKVCSVFSLRMIGLMMDQASTSCLYIDPVAFPVEGVVVDCCYMATATNTTTGIGVDTNNSVGNSSIKDVKISNTTFNTSASGVRFTGNCDMIGVSTCSFIGLPATAVSFDQAKNVKMTGCDFQANNFDMFIKDGDNGGPFNIANNNFTSNISQVTTISSRFGKTNNSGY